MDTSSIPKSDFNDAIQAAIAAAQPLLLQVEADVAAVAAITGPIDSVTTLQTDLAALHAELSNQLSIADDMGSSGTMHTDTGGTNKGQA